MAVNCERYKVLKCKRKEDGTMENWKARAKKDSAGRFIRFDEDTPAHVVTFMEKVKDADGMMVDSPNRVEKDSTQRKGETYAVYDFGVREDGEDRIMSVSQKSLLRQLVEEDDVEPLPGRTLMIKCLDLKRKTEWKIREVKEEKAVQQAWSAEKAEEKTVVEKTKPNKKGKQLFPTSEQEKENFHEEVAKRKSTKAEANQAGTTEMEGA